MYNALSGKFFDENGNVFTVNEGYVRKDHPSKLFRQGKDCRWRSYTPSGGRPNSKRHYWRFYLFEEPQFVK